MPKVLISDKMSSLANQTFKERGIEVEVATGLEPAALAERINGFDGLVVRSATKVTSEVLAAGELQ